MNNFPIRLVSGNQLLTILVTCCAAIYAESTATAQQPAEAKAPIKRVVLFSSGVGYFEHRGQVVDDATIDLKFNVDDVNDLLKSMVLQDLDGGRVSTVTYGSRDPITKTLQTFAIDLTSNPTLGDLLGQIRGERVEIEAPSKIVGTIVGLEKRQTIVGNDQTVEMEYVTLLTEGGLRRVVLDSIGRIKLTNAELDAEFRQALAVLAAGHATDKKTVTLEFIGQGERDVRVGYIQESPIWKTSYRLVLDDQEKPYLQGWAIVENTTEADWTDVQLSLVSGQPISFAMDLYSPLYAQRPTIAPQIHASLNPQLYEQDISMSAQFYARSGAEEFTPTASAAAADAPDRAMKSLAVRALNGRGAFESGLGGGGFGDGLDDSGVTAPGLRSSLRAQSEAADVGELFRYDISTPVTLVRQRSAMLPIITDQVEGEKLSIYSPGVHAKHPLNGVRLKNSTALHLMQGPVTVFDGGAYAGDARIPDLPSGSERLLSYALDLDVEVAPKGDQRPQQLTKVRVNKGVLLATFEQTRTHTYVVKSSAAKSKNILVEHEISPDWQLQSPSEADEETRSAYRFAVDAEPGKPTELAIVEQRSFDQQIVLSNVSEGDIRFYIGAAEVSDEIKEALGEIIRRKAVLADLHRQAQQIEKEIAAIGQEQDRIRRNMQSVGRGNDLYNRYVLKFTEQEDRIEALRAEARTLQAEITSTQKSLDEFLSSMQFE